MLTSWYYDPEEGPDKFVLCDFEIEIEVSEVTHERSPDL